jgi:diguanylate cyclase (GGDEF)-like protein
VAGAFLARAAVDRRRRRRLEREVAARTAELAAANLRITDQNRRLEELSRTDPLTGLANRRALEEQLPLEMAILRREVERLGGVVPAGYHGCAVLVLDLDHFKSVNDRFGHDIGDAALRAVAAALRAGLREVDLPVRWGGEELVVLARSVDRVGVEILACKLLATVAATRVPLPGGGDLALSASVGFVLHPLTAGLPPDGAEWRSLVDAADRLMYLAKERGRRRACGVRWATELPPPGSGRGALERVQREPVTPPEGLELVEVELPG